MSSSAGDTEWCRVIYPSNVLGLEKHGFFPYERFAYNALRIGTEALGAVGLSTALTVSFDSKPDGVDPATLNAWISETEDGSSGYAITTTLFTPPVLLALCHRVGVPLFNQRDAKGWSKKPQLLQKELQAIAAMLVSASNALHAEGAASAGRMLRDGGGYTVITLQDSVNLFDAVAQFIVNHEAAHAYVKQFERLRSGLTAEDHKAFEFLADLTATSWLYRKFVANTPDTEAYRRTRRFKSHAHAIRANTQLVLEAQLLVLIFLGLSEALRSGGKVTLEGGRLHPHTIVRHNLQQVHLLTLVMSNFSSAYPDSEVNPLDKWWSDVMVLLYKVGLVPISAHDAMIDDEHYKAVRRAGDLVGELGIAELTKAAPFLTQLKGMKLDSPPTTAPSLAVSFAS
jgi:hypothetical protein